MFKLKQQIDGHIQEVVFFFSLLIAFSAFLSGALYLALSPDQLTYILGQFGSFVDRGLFTFLGYGFFYLSVMALHLGYVANFHIFSINDLKKEYPVLLYSALAHSIIMILFSNLLSVIQLSLEIAPSQLLSHGSGGMIGRLFSSALYSGVGIYGSVLSLLALIGVTALLGGFFEIPDVVIAVKIASEHTKKIAVKSLKTANSSLINGIQFLARQPEMQEVTVTATHAAHHSKKWINNSWNKANHLMTDHFHIYKKEEKKAETKDSKNEEKSEKINEKINQDTLTHFNEKVRPKSIGKKIEKDVDLKAISAKLQKKSAPAQNRPLTKALEKSAKRATESSPIKPTSKLMEAKKVAAVSTLEAIKQKNAAAKSVAQRSKPKKRPSAS